MPTLSAKKQVLLINHENKCFDYEISVSYTDGGAEPSDMAFIEKAIYNYIEENLDFKNYFLASKDLWTNIVARIILPAADTIIDDKIELINSLITAANYKIKKIFIVNAASYSNEVKI